MMPSIGDAQHLHLGQTAKQLRPCALMTLSHAMVSDVCVLMQGAKHQQEAASSQAQWQAQLAKQEAEHARSQLQMRTSLDQLESQVVI